MSIAGSFSLGIIASPPGLPASPVGILGCSTLALAAVRLLRVLRTETLGGWDLLCVETRYRAVVGIR